MGDLESWEALGRACPANISELRSALSIEWVREALEKAGKATIRRRKLPNEAVVWLVVGMALFTNRSIESVVKHLGLAEEEADVPRRPSPTGSPVSSGGAARARARVGAEPLEELFSLSAAAWEEEVGDLDTWKGLKLRALDGSTLRIADSPANEEVYGRPGSTRSPAAYPQARVISVLGLGSRVMVDFVVGTYHQGEQTLAQMLYPRLSDDTLVVLDRNFINHASFVRIPSEARNRHFLCRGREKGRMSWSVVRKLGPRDSLIELRVPPHHRSQDRSLPTTVVVRLLEYQIKGFGQRRLLTSMLDPETYPAAEIIELYHRRWEIELAYGEIKTQTLGRREALRSRDPELVRQEIWGLALAYNLVRIMMARAARAAGVAPNRMSFRNSLLQVQSFLLMAWNDKPGTLPRLYADLLTELSLLVLPERRHRHYPRAVKIKMSNYNKAPR